MFYFLSKLFQVLINPICWVILLSILIITRSSSTLIKRFAYAIIIMMLIMSNGQIINTIMLNWEPPKHKIDELHEDYDYAIVLTGDINRVYSAIQMYKKAKVKNICVVGRTGRVDYESELIRNGVNKEHIFSEDQSKNTYENAKKFKGFMAELNQKNIDSSNLIMITTAFHIKRATMCFNKQGIEVTPFGTQHISYQGVPFRLLDLIPTGLAIYYWEKLIKECFGILVYKIMGYA